MNYLNFLSADTSEFIIALVIIVCFVIGVFALPAYVQHVRIQRRRKKKIFPLPELSDEGRGMAAVLGMAAMIWGTAILLIVMSCSPEIRGLHTEGHILKAEPDRIFVLFEDAMGKPGHYSGNWFYVPGATHLNIDHYTVQVNLKPIKP